MDRTSTHQGPMGVIFTHAAISKDEAEGLENAASAKDFIRERQAFFSGCLSCSNIGVVYVFVDLGLRDLRMDRGPRGELTGFSIWHKTAALEQRVFGALRSAERRARSRQGQKNQRPKFVYVGVSQLVHLLNAILEIDPLLVRPVGGQEGIFTYDSPKFIEAVIRVARGVDPCLCRQPIMRFDWDVTPNEEGVNELLATAQEKMRDEERYFFFSGQYKGENRPDPLNQHAVRTHWFFDGQTPGTPGWERAAGGCNRFLGDLGEVGAVQLSLDPKYDLLPSGTQAIPHSEVGLALVHPGVLPRSPQVISGAGLLMSFACILELPPFLTTPHMVVWVDDHLKRRLHEQVGHIAATDTEALPAVHFSQHRPHRDRQWCSNIYAERLFRGCLMHGLIVADDGCPGDLAEWVERAIRGQLRRAPSKGPGGLYDRGKNQVHTKKEFLTLFGRNVESCGNRVLRIWKLSGQAYGDDLLSDWATTLLSPARGSRVSFQALCSGTAEDAYEYLQLVADWWYYVRAILRLDRISADWLFEPAW